MFRKKIRIKKTKKYIKPFRGYDEVSMRSGISSYEWFIFILVLAQLCFLIYLIIKSFI